MSQCQWPACLDGLAGGAPYCRHDPTSARCPLVAAVNTPTPSPSETPDTLLGIAPPTEED